MVNNGCKIRLLESDCLSEKMIVEIISVIVADVLSEEADESGEKAVKSSR